MKTVWITRELSEKEREWCSTKAIRVIEIPTIHIELEDVEHIQIPHFPAWVFTSQHAVEWITKRIETENLPPEILPEQWFAVGEKTAETIRSLHFEPILPDEASGANIAVLLDSYKVRSVLHFSGNLTRPELQQACMILGINYHAMEVYSTLIKAPELLPKGTPDAILFMSPSALEGFLLNHSASKMMAHSRILCIGKTTQAAVQHAGFSAEVSKKSTFESLIELAIDSY